MTKTNALSVLVMDDEPTVCRSADKILTRCGYRVCAASSVAEALDLLDAGQASISSSPTS